MGKGQIDSDDPLRGRISGRLSQYIDRGVNCNGTVVCSAEGVKEDLETPMVMLTLRGEGRSVYEVRSDSDGQLRELASGRLSQYVDRSVWGMGGFSVVE